jgi:hypothetical protein
MNVKLLEKQCTDGDVKLEKDGTPMFFWAGTWSPICGHWFKDNQFGAISFCKKLGYTRGVLDSSTEKYDEDSIRIGNCNEGESLKECTGGCNDKGLGDGCAECSTGKGIRITITCAGHTPETFLSSCKGIQQILVAIVLALFFSYSYNKFKSYEFNYRKPSHGIL